MESSEKVTLRVLYTVNTSPQYILAKAPEKVLLVQVNATSGSTSQLHYGRAPLKSCALAICRSSPELRPDMTKDFSVYVLDPLEDFLSKGGQGAQSGGVAVGMGSLSSIVSPLSRDESLVTGTIVECGLGETALEVVISLRQLAPSLATFGALTYSRPSEVKRSKSTVDEPFFTSKPLPSLDEQILRVQERRQSEASQQYAPPPPQPLRKENPSHSTRAHAMPTPYIGPPRRKYAGSTVSDTEPNRDGSEPSRSQSADRESRTSSQGSTQTISKASAEPTPAPQTPPIAALSSSTTPSQVPSMSDSAILLAALSCVNGKEGGEGSSNNHDGSVPNPNLVAFLRAYLASLEKPQNLGAAVPDAAVSAQLAAASSRSSDALSDLAFQGTARSATPQGPSPSRSADKENQRPLSPPKNNETQKSERKSDPPRSNTSPLAPARFSSHWNQKNAPAAISSDPPVPARSASASSSQQRKRKLSDCADGFAREDGPGNKPKSTAKRTPRIEDENGVPINRGWGGLRMRADGTFSGGHPAKPPSAATATSQARPLFRSASLASAPVRKGPYVIPDWAKGVPPPAPPPKKDVESDDKQRETKKNKSKPIGLGRLGGKSSVKRSSSLSTAPDDLGEQVAEKSPPSSSQEPPSTPKRSQTSPKRLTPAGLPIFAQSSPLAKGSFGAFFRAFQTSPARPNESCALPSTPKSSERNAHSDSEEAENRYSLFTPSPASNGRSVRSRSVLADPPGSPTPSQRRARSMSLLESPTRSINCKDLPSSLPVASSDDDVVQPSTSSDSTVMNTSTSFMHDWSSLDLPPSSPPPPSSPVLVPMENSDLPCSDIPSPECSDVTTPSASVISMEDRPTPDNGQEQQTNSLADPAPCVTCVNDADLTEFSTFFADPAFSDFLQQMSGPADFVADSAMEALQNGLAQEDLSETWNVLNDIVTNAAVASSSETQVQDWLVASNAEAQDLGKPDDSSFLNSCGFDQSNQLALNFEDLFQGCLV